MRQCRTMLDYPPYTCVSKTWQDKRAEGERKGYDDYDNFTLKIALLAIHQEWKIILWSCML